MSRPNTLAPTTSAACEADDERGGGGGPSSSSSSSEDPDARPTALSKKMRLARRNPIRFGYSVRRTAPQTTSPAGPSSSTAGPSSALSPPLPPPARARVPLPFENGSSDSGEVEVDRVTLRRQQGDRPLPTIPTPMTTVEASLQSGTVAEAAAGLRKGKGKVVKRMVGRPANAKKSMNPKAHLEPLKPGHTRVRRVPRQPSGLDSPLRALQLASSPPSPVPVFDSSTRRRSIAASLRTPARSRSSAFRTSGRPDFTFPRFPTTAAASTPALRRPKITPPRQAAPVRALSDWTWGFDLDLVRAKGVRDVLGDIDMLDGRLPGDRHRRGQRRLREQGKTRGLPGVGGDKENEIGRRNGLPPLTLVQPDSDNDADESAANSPYRLPVPPPRPTGRPPLASGVTPSKRPRAQPVFQPRPITFSVPNRTLSTADPLAPSESVVDRETGRSAHGQPSASTVVDSDSIRLPHRAQSPLPPPPPPSKSSIAESSAATHKAVGAAFSAGFAPSRREPSIRLSGLIGSLLSETHTALVRDESVSRKGKSVPLRRTSLVGPTPRCDVFGTDTLEAANSDPSAVRQAPKVVDRSGSTVENGSPTAVGAPHPRPSTSADVAIEESTADSAASLGRSAPSLVASASLDSFSGGMSFPPEAEPSPDGGAGPMDDIVEGSVNGPPPTPLAPPTSPTSGTASRGQPLTTEEVCQAVLDEPLILALSSGGDLEPPPAPTRTSPQSSQLVPLTRDLGWRHLILSQASGSDERIDTGPPVNLCRTPEGRSPVDKDDPLGPPFDGGVEASTAPAAQSPEAAAAFNDWAFEGMIGLTDLLAFEQQQLLASSRSTDDDMDVDPDPELAGEAEAEAWQAMVEAMKVADAVDEVPADMRSPSPTPVATAAFALPSLHFPSSATPAPSTPSSTPLDAPPALTAVRKVKGILRSSSPATEVDSEGRTETNRSRRSKTVTFAPSDSDGGSSDARRGRSAPVAGYDHSLRSPSKSLANARPPVPGPSRKGSKATLPHRIPRFKPLRRVDFPRPRTSRRSSEAPSAAIPSYQPRPQVAEPGPSRVEPTFLPAATLMEPVPVPLSFSSPLSSPPPSSLAAADAR